MKTNKIFPRFKNLGLLALGAVVAVACGAVSEPSVAPEPVPAHQPEPESRPSGREYPAPPAASTPKPVNFPELTKFQMDNGLKVYVVENHEVPIVSTQLVIRAGTMDDEHVADFTAYMLGEGTTSRTKAKIDEAIEFVGGSIEANAGVHTTTVFTRVLKKDLKLGLTLLADEVLNPKFGRKALEKLKKQAITGLDAAKADPETLASVLFDTVAYPEGHPYGRPFPEEEDINAVSVDDIRKFHETFYWPNNSYLILSGDLTRAEAEPLLKRALGKWKGGDAKDLPPNPLNQFKDYNLPGNLVIHLVDRPRSIQSEIRVGNLAIARSHDDWIKTEVANSILGAGPSGRLFMDIREERGLTYAISSRLSSGQGPGTFTIATRCKTKKTGEMMQGIFEHIAKIHDTEPTEKEFSAVQAKMTGQFPLGIETAGQIAGKVGTILEYNLAEDYYKTYRDKVAAVTAADVKSVARKYVHLVPHVVIVGQAKTVEKQLKAILPEAKFVFYDTDLKKK